MADGPHLAAGLLLGFAAGSLPVFSAQEFEEGLIFWGRERIARNLKVFHHLVYVAANFAPIRFQNLGPEFRVAAGDPGGVSPGPSGDVRSIEVVCHLHEYGGKEIRKVAEQGDMAIVFLRTHPNRIAAERVDHVFHAPQSLSGGLTGGRHDPGASTKEVSRRGIEAFPFVASHRMTADESRAEQMGDTFDDGRFDARAVGDDGVSGPGMPYQLHGGPRRGGKDHQPGFRAQTSQVRMDLSNGPGGQRGSASLRVGIDPFDDPPCRLESPSHRTADEAEADDEG